MDARERVLGLSHPDAVSPDRSGAKAANLARSAVAGLPVVPGFVLTTEAVAIGLRDAGVLAELRTAWQALAAGDPPLVVRSSSTIEDAGESSMAGRFTSVLDVRGWEGFLHAVTRVIQSADTVRDADGVSRPLAVLVQRQLAAGLGGVLFGVDPVSGDRRHLVVEAVASRPDTLVSGTAIADHYVLSRRGRVIDEARAGSTPSLSPLLRRRLARLAARTASIFGSPQDVEWAVDAEGRLWLLQSRPVTAVAAGGGDGPVLGPGPVAETFPAPLTRLETALWIDPLRSGVTRALRATGAVPERVIDASPVVTTVGGWACVDLDLFGLTSGHTSLRRRMNPAAIGRRLTAAWRVGRLRVALPALAATAVATVDRELSSVPRLDRLTPAELVALLDQVRRQLELVHTYEVLAGMLLHRDEPGTVPGPLVALCALHDGRVAGWSDEEIVVRDPVVLALVPPSLDAALHETRFPHVAPSPLRSVRAVGGVESAGGVDDLGLRDALRLRARWLQELGARAAQALGEQFAGQGGLTGPELIARLDLAELAALAAGRPAPADLDERRDHPGPPLPSAFRLGGGGLVRPARRTRTGKATGLPAGGGRGTGEARHRLLPGATKEGIVLITRHLEPQLAPLLPSLDGLVSETGSALSHLAILAREMSVPTVVAVEGALQRFPPGTHLLVDGMTGDIEVLEARPASAGRRGEGGAWLA